MISQDYLSRRQMLKYLAAVGGATLLPACETTRGVNDRPPWLPGLQLYTLGDAPKQDLEGTLRQVAALGYRAVEFPSPYHRSARQLRDALHETGLVCPSIHVPLQSLPGYWDLEGDLMRLADDVKAIGATYVVVGGPLLPDNAIAMVRKSIMGEPQPDLPKVLGSLCADNWKRTADLLNEKGSVLARSDLRIAYHNHDMEFLALTEGKTGYDILLEGTDPGIVALQLDVGWVSSAGQDPVALLERLGQRVRLMHLKDVKQTSNSVLQFASADIGTGIVDWEKLIPAIRRARIGHLFVEQEPPFSISPMHSARIAYDFLSEAFARVS